MRILDSRTRRNLGRTERIASVAGGSGLLIWSLVRPSLGKIISALGAGYLVYRGASGRDPVYRKLGIVRWNGRGIEVVQSITIMRPREDVYAFWRNLANLPSIMQHLEEVRILDDVRSLWRAKAPMGMHVEWEAEISEDRKNELISWRSLPGSQIRTEGTVQFADAPDGSGTEVEVDLTYIPPGGSAGAAVAKAFGEEPDTQIRDDLRRLKQFLETGRVPSTHGQSSGRSRQVKRERAGGRKDRFVEQEVVE